MPKLTVTPKLNTETRPGRVRPEFYSLLRSGWLEWKRSTKWCHYIIFSVSTAKFELGSKCNSTLVDDRSKTPYGFYPLGDCREMYA